VSARITVLGDKLLPAGPLPLDGYDLVFFVAGEPAALGSARRARFVAATVRELPTLRESGGRARPARRERERPKASATTAHCAYRHLAVTDGANGGTLDGVPFATAPAGPIVDTYGAGDSFAAGLAFALARGDVAHVAAELAARAGAAVTVGAGPYEAQLASPE